MFFTVHLKICDISISGLFDPMSLNMCRMLRSALG